MSTCKPTHNEVISKQNGLTHLWCVIVLITMKQIFFTNVIYTEATKLRKAVVR